jgi:putative component of toxin-antitoxin plasmid stabilization module
MIGRWRLNQYVSPLGREAITDWRKKLHQGSSQPDFDAFLKTVAKKENWDYPDIGPMKGVCQGLTELRWKSGRVPHRIIGYQTGDFEYLMLIGCTHNGKKYDPPNALETAARRRGEIQNKEASVSEFKLITDEGTTE